jgi:two-component system chemotaxis sensor kinase CheA
MRARLQPVGGLFGKFTRIVRDLSHKLNKEIQLEIFGDDVELDRTLLEGLSDPLTHLIRNSIDHGIEQAANRLAAGKAAHGTVRLSAAHLAGRVQIEVTDDGAGMDPERLKAKAVEKGVISPDQAQRMTDSEALNLIFAAGFSTASAVSDISGRGVGMDVVKTNIEKLGGHVDLDSQLGKGTRITIRLPLTLAIVPALIVGCRGSSYALPQINVEEIVRPSPECPIKTIGGARVLELRGELIPVVDLAGLLNEPSTGRDEFVVLLQLDHSIFGLIVDEIRSNEEIVVKPLGRHLRTVPYYSGATLLGQGEIALILDPTAMAQGRIQATQKALGSSKALETTEHAKSSRVLVFQAGGAEPLAVPLGKVLRVESVDAEDIERIGAVDCLRKKHDSTIRLVQLSDLLPISAPEARGERFFIIVPRPPYDTVGFIATKILDSIDLPDSQIEQGALSTQGLLGSAVILDRLTLVIDMPSILEMLAGVGLEPASLVAEGRFLLTTNPSQNQNHPIKQLPAQPGQNNPS